MYTLFLSGSKRSDTSTSPDKVSGGSLVSLVCGDGRCHVVARSKVSTESVVEFCGVLKVTEAEVRKPLAVGVTV